MDSHDKSFLAIDASTEHCSVALCCGGQKYTQTCETPKSHANVLLPMIDAVLQEGAVPLKDLNALVVSLGPGSFTGIRIGIGVTQGLAYGSGLPIIGFSSLETLAWQVFCDRKSLGHKLLEGTVILPCLDARMSEVYWAAYICKDNSICEIHSPCVTDIQSLRIFVTQLDTECIGAGHGWYVADAPQLKQCDFAVLPKAVAMLDLIDEYKRCSKVLSEYTAANIEPLYLRNEVTWVKRTRIRKEQLI